MGRAGGAGRKESRGHAVRPRAPLSGRRPIAGVQSRLVSACREHACRRNHALSPAGARETQPMGAPPASSAAAPKKELTPRTPPRWRRCRPTAGTGPRRLLFGIRCVSGGEGRGVEDVREAEGGAGRAGAAAGESVGTSLPHAPSSLTEGCRTTGSSCAPGGGTWGRRREGRRRPWCFVLCGRADGNDRVERECERARTRPAPPPHSLSPLIIFIYLFLSAPAPVRARCVLPIPTPHTAIQSPSTHPGPGLLH